MTTTHTLRALLCGTSSARPAASTTGWLAALLLGLAALLASCGGGGNVPATQPGGLRPLSADFATRKAVNYSPYRSTNRDTEVVTRENVLQDLGLLAQGGFTLIRTFDSSDEFARLMLQIIKDNGINMKVQLGIFIAPTGSSVTGADLARARAFNSAEVARGIKLANDFKDIVIAVSVGNESIAFGGSTPEVMAAYLTTVRSGVSQPLTTNDVWDAYAGVPGSGGAGMPPYLINLIDFAAVHTYPILYASPGYYDPWDWEQQAVAPAGRAAAMMDAAVERVNVNLAAVRKHLTGLGHANMPIVLGEAGWKAVPTGDLTYLAHPVNQKMFYDRLLALGDKSKNPNAPAAIFYFEAFDEPWKATANPNFNDDHWGLFTVDRKARYVVQSLYAASQWAPGTFTLADAVYAPTVVSQVVTANRYTVYADAVTAGEAIAPAAQWFGFDSPPNAFAGEGSDAALAAEGLRFMEIGPAPSTAVGKDYGWGVLTVTAPPRVDLSPFLANGKINFSIKTTYPGKLMFGFGTPVAGAVFVVASNTNADGYGYINDGTWRRVSIPISAFTAAGAKFDLTKVTNTLVVADVYDRTGNTGNRGNTTKVFIDSVYWSK